MTANTDEDVLKEEPYLWLAMLMIVVPTEIGVEFSKNIFKIELLYAPNVPHLGI